MSEPREEFDQDLVSRIAMLVQRIEELEAHHYTPYRGTSAIDFTTTTLPYEGDYGFQTTDDEIQWNADGTIMAVGIAAL